MSSAALLALVRNDLRLYATDRRAMVVGILVPILIAAFFGYVFGGTGDRGESGKIPIAVVDEDQGAVSQAITAALAVEPLLSVQTLGRADAEARVRQGKVHVAAIIPKGFTDAATRAFLGGRQKPRLDLLFDPSQSLSNGIVEGLFAKHAMEEISKAALSASGAADLRQALRVPYEVTSAKLMSGVDIPYNGYAHSFAGMTIQFILFAGIDSGIALLLLRDRGIWQRFRAAPLSKTEFLLARTIATPLISLLQFSLIYTAAIVVFGVRVSGSVAGFIALLLAICLTNAAFGLMLASVGRNAGAARGIASLVTLLLVMLGGAWVPAFVFPTWLQQASLAAPTRWAIDGLDAVTWRGLGFHSVSTSLVVLLATSAICLAIAIWRFRWEE